MVDSSLVAAYEQAWYVIFADGHEIVTRIGELSAELEQLMQTENVGKAAFITAWNPASELLPDGQNQARQRELILLVQAQGLSYRAGEGRDPDGAWKPEASLLIAGIDRSLAVYLAERFGQHGFVWFEAGKPAELVLTEV